MLSQPYYILLRIIHMVLGRNVRPSKSFPAIQSQHATNPPTFASPLYKIEFPFAPARGRHLELSLVLNFFPLHEDSPFSPFSLIESYN